MREPVGVEQSDSRRGVAVHRPELPEMVARTYAGGPQQVFAVQRAAGNAAVGQLLRGRERCLDRCGCRGAVGSCGCGSGVAEPDDELELRGVSALRRAVLARQPPGAKSDATTPASPAAARILHRSPAFRANPSWSQIGADNPAPCCTPFASVFGQSPEADAKWELYARVLPGKVVERCGCRLVGDAYARYLSAVGGTVTLADDGNCISEGLAQEADPHHPFEQARLTAWRAVEDDFIRRGLPAGTSDVELDLIEAERGRVTVVGAQAPAELEVDGITYADNTKSGGLLFGSGHDSGDPTDDSECGRDTRVMTASVQLHRTDDGSDPTRMTVSETFTFRYRLHDGFDFCPGNTTQMVINWSEPREIIEQRLEYNQLLTDLSRLEASGMARDVCFNVRYHRTLPAVSHTVGIPAVGPQLAPAGVVTADVLHVRGGPGTAFPIVGRKSRGSVLTFDCFSPGESVNGDANWCQISGTTHWVAHAFIADSGAGRLPGCP